MKTFPIRSERAIPLTFKFVEWKIHNVCNYNCSFCGDRHKDGSQRWFTLEQYKEVIDKLIKLSGTQKLWIHITGGEPTLFPGLLELLVHMKSQGAYVSLASNGIRTTRWWVELRDAKVLDSLFITQHSEQDFNYQRTAELVNLFHDEPVEVSSLVTHDRTSIDRAFIAYDYLQQNTGGYVLLKAMNIKAYDLYSLYTSEQLDKIRNSFGNGLLPGKKKSLVPEQDKLNYRLRIHDNQGGERLIGAVGLMKNKENVFTGWDCEAGQNQMRIDYDTIYRGICEIGGLQKITDEAISFASDTIKCTKEDCVCLMDLISTKTRPKE